MVATQAGIMEIGSGTYMALLINYTVVWAPDEEEPTDTIYILETLWILEGLYANKEEGKLILFAEMKLQGDGSNLKL
jgi:hypothetical protein